MSALFEQLGINGAALLAHGVNFLLVLVVLTFAVYRPLMKLLAERRHMIEQGLADARAAAGRLAEADAEKAALLAAADRDAARMIKDAETEARTAGERVVAEMDAKAESLVAAAKERALHERAQAMELLGKDASKFVRLLFEKTVGLDPRAADEALIGQAAQALKRENI